MPGKAPAWVKAAAPEPNAPARGSGQEERRCPRVHTATSRVSARARDRIRSIFSRVQALADPFKRGREQPPAGLPGLQRAVVPAVFSCVVVR